MYLYMSTHMPKAHPPPRTPPTPLSTRNGDAENSLRSFESRLQAGSESPATTAAASHTCRSATTECVPSETSTLRLTTSGVEVEPEAQAAAGAENDKPNGDGGGDSGGGDGSAPSLGSRAQSLQRSLGARLERRAHERQLKRHVLAQRLRQSRSWRGRGTTVSPPLSLL